VTAPTPLDYARWRETRLAVAATFHPELTDDETIHRYFLGKMGL